MTRNGGSMYRDAKHNSPVNLLIILSLSVSIFMTLGVFVGYVSGMNDERQEWIVACPQGVEDG